MRTVRRFSLLVLLIVGLQQVIFAQTAASRDETLHLGRFPVTFTLNTESGMLYGMATELVYDQSVSTNYKVSELDWPLQPLVYWGGGLDVDYRGFYAAVRVRNGLSGKTGSIIDSDFLNGDGMRTNFSQSDAYAERALLADLRAGWNALAAGPLRLGLFASMEYMDFKWSARDGYLQYPTSGSMYSFTGSGQLIPGTFQDWSASESKIPVYGTVILYQQSYVYPAFGVSLDFAPRGPLSLSASLAYSPFVFCNDLDNHELRQLDFYSSMTHGSLIEPKLDLSLRVSERAGFQLSLSYRSITGLIGSAEAENVGTTSPPYYAGPSTVSVSANTAGAAIANLDASLAFRLVY